MASEAFRPLALGLKQAMLLGYLLERARTSTSASDFGRATETNSAAMVRLVASRSRSAASSPGGTIRAAIAGAGPSSSPRRASGWRPRVKTASAPSSSAEVLATLSAARAPVARRAPRGKGDAPLRRRGGPQRPRPGEAISARGDRRSPRTCRRTRCCGSSRSRGNRPAGSRARSRSRRRGASPARR